MVSSKHKKFRAAVRKNLPLLRKGKRITEEQLDRFTEGLMADRSYDVDGKIYCRDAFAFVNRIDGRAFQIAAFQVNSFDKGIFGDSVTRFVTPVLLGVEFHNKHRIMRPDVRDSLLSIGDYYLGSHYCGSKSPLCIRDKFNDFARKLFTPPDNAPITVHRLLHRLITANYLCHHIAETTAYAIAALHKHYLRDEDMCFMSSGYQKAQLRKYSEGVNVITTQHMIDFILQDYFKLVNIFVTTNTYQTLEYLSRAMVARREGHMDEFSAYMKTATFCMGYCPERDLDGVLSRKTAQFPEFRKEFFYSTFFRPPVFK